MRTLSRLFPLAAAVLAWPGCATTVSGATDTGSTGTSTGSSTTGASSGSGATGTCTWPASADTSMDAGAAGFTGCHPAAPGQICSVSGPGSEDCKPLCAGSDYELTCEGTGVPDASLGCTVIPIPTPFDTTFYCCPCAP